MTEQAHHIVDQLAKLLELAGAGIILGGIVLVGADIISTITAPLTFESVALLAGIVAIRTFLSFSLETEIEGCWPWQRAGKRASDERVTR